MTVRIPPKADIETQNAFRDVEMRLQALERAVGKAGLSATQMRDIQNVMSAVDKIKPDPDKYEEPRETTFVGPVNFLGTARFPTEPDLGFISNASDTLDTSAQSVHNLHGSLAIVPGGLSADSVLCRELNVHGTATAVPVAAAFNFNTYTTSGSTYILRWSITTFNTDDSKIYTDVADDYENVYVANGGHYSVTATALTDNSAGGQANFNLIRYNSSDAAQETSTFRTIADSYASAFHSRIFACEPGDYFTVDFTRVAGTGLPYTPSQIFSYFTIEKLN